MCVCVCVRLAGHGRQLKLHCSSSLAVINRHVSFPMVPFAWWRQSSPWRARGVQAASPPPLTLELTDEHSFMCTSHCYTCGRHFVFAYICTSCADMQEFKTLGTLIVIDYFHRFTDLSIFATKIYYSLN